MAPDRSAESEGFTGFARFLHWTMAVMVLVMLFIGVSMVSSISAYHALLAVHRPLGIAILLFVLIRLGYRVRHRPPEHPASMHRLDHLAATTSEYLLYALLVVQPLVGWATVSASGTPIVLAGSLRLPPIAPTSPSLYATLHQTHVVLAYLLFFVFLAHLIGVLLHALVLRDGIFERMTPRVIRR